MLKQAIQKMFREILATEYPYLRTPAVVYARVESAKRLSTSCAANDLQLHNDETGSSYRGHITAYWYEYRLTVLDRFGNTDENFPALPAIRSRKQFNTGATVAVAFPNGDLVPTIIGEVEL